LSAGTANGVLYLNSSKVATSGSALTFDGTSLAVGGVPTVQGELNVFKSGSAPTLYVQCDTSNNTTQGIIRIGGASARSASIQGFREASSNAQALRFYSYNSADVLSYEITSGGTSIWSVAGSEQMRLTSTGLGIGTSSPGFKLDLKMSSATRTGGFVIRRSTNDNHQLGLWTSGGAMYFDAVTDNPAGAGTTIFRRSADSGSTFTESMTISADGNLGLGVTPSAWGSNWRVVDQLIVASMAASSAGAGDYGPVFNAYNDNTNWRYKYTGGASMRYRLNESGHAWFTAPSGTAGNAISFTQVMTLDASGNLAVGGTSVYAASITSYGTASRSGGLGIRNSAGTVAGGIYTYAAGSGGGSTDVVVEGQNSLQFYTGTSPAERARIDSSGNLVVANTSALGRLDIGLSGTSRRLLVTFDDSLVTLKSANSAANPEILRIVGENVQFNTGTTGSGSERARIDSSGNLLVGKTTSAIATAGVTVTNYGSVQSTTATTDYSIFNKVTSTTGKQMEFRSANTSVGDITCSSTATTYNTSSDYRLKENIQPMIGALAKVQALKPCTYNWKIDGSDGEGFIAHELAEVVPQCVTGEKDAVDAEGKPVYQGIDTSFLVATLTAAIQEQQAIIEQLKADVAALKGA
jgi:hypothetical protein